MDFVLMSLLPSSEMLSRKAPALLPGPRNFGGRPWLPQKREAEESIAVVYPQKIPSGVSVQHELGWGGSCGPTQHLSFRGFAHFLCLENSA